MNKEVKMTDIAEFIKQQGEFLKADLIKDGTIAKIVGVATSVHNEKYDTDRLHIPVIIEGKEYTFDCSKTNARTIASVLGTETENWKDAELVLETYKTKTSEGVMTKAINIVSVKG